MATVLDYKALVTAEDIIRDGIASTNLDADVDGPIINRAVMDMTGVIETRLNRGLIVRQYQEVVYWDRYSLRPLWNDYPIDVKAYPVVQIISATDEDGVDKTSEYRLMDETFEAQYQILADNYDPVRLVYWAGYRRSEDESLLDVQGYSPSHATLTRLPPVLPWDIRSVVTELVLHRLALAETQQFGQGRKILGVAGSDVSISAPQEDFVQNRLMMLSKHRRLV